jgi:hypothetical protein
MTYSLDLRHAVSLTTLEESKFEVSLAYTQFQSYYSQ